MRRRWRRWTWWKRRGQSRSVEERTREKMEEVERAVEKRAVLVEAAATALRHQVLSAQLFSKISYFEHLIPPSDKADMDSHHPFSSFASRHPGSAKTYPPLPPSLPRPRLMRSHSAMGQFDTNIGER